MGAKSGYEAARWVHEARLKDGWRAVGRKIGFTNRSIWPRYGVYEPIWGTVYDRTLIRAQAGRATVSLAGFEHPRIEPEICFKLKATPRGAEPQALLAALEWVAHSIEIVQFPRADWQMTLEEATARNGLHACLVLGEPIAVSALPRLVETLPQAAVTLSRGDTEVDHGSGANVLDSPLNALAFLAQCCELQAGEIVSTGTLTDAHPVRPGESWRTAFTGLPLAGLAVDFT